MAVMAALWPMSHASRPKMTSITISLFLYCLALLSYQNPKLSSSKSFFSFLFFCPSKPNQPLHFSFIGQAHELSYFFFQHLRVPSSSNLSSLTRSPSFLFCHYKTHTNTNSSFLVTAPSKTKKSTSFYHHWNSSSLLSNPIDQCQHLHHDSTTSLFPTTTTSNSSSSISHVVVSSSPSTTMNYSSSNNTCSWSN